MPRIDPEWPLNMWSEGKVTNLAEVKDGYRYDAQLIGIKVTVSILLDEEGGKASDTSLYVPVGNPVPKIGDQVTVNALVSSDEEE